MSLMFALFLGILCSQKELYAQQITGGLIVDSGLQKACAQAGGVFRPRTDAQSVTGDICEMSFSVVTSDEADATNFCELYAPWRLRSVRIEKDVAGFTRTVCVVEATFTCGAGWIQMFGHCFRRLDKFSRHNQTEAKNICANLDGHKGSIAYLHHRYIVGVWKNFFKGISQIWVDGSETWDQYIVKTGSVDGRALALAFTGDTFDFSVMPNSLISIDPNLKLEVLCQYKPDLTPAEVNYLGRRYSEIYYPGVHVSDGVLIRSASHYTRSKTNLEVCKKVLKSFYITEIEPFMPTQEVMELLTNNRPKSSHFTRSGGEYPFNLYRDLIRPKECFGGAHTYEIPYANGSSKPFELPLREIIECDNMNSVAITHFAKGAAFVPMSDSQTAPVWCKFGKRMNYKIIAPEGWTPYVRSNGEVVAHKIFMEAASYDQALHWCRNENAKLGGFNDRKEFEAIAALITVHQTNRYYRLGAHQRDECDGVSGYTGIEGGTCYRDRIFGWIDNVASENIDESLWGDDEPDGGRRRSALGCWGSNCVQNTLVFSHFVNSHTDGIPRITDSFHDDRLPYVCTMDVTMIPIL